MTFQFPLRIDVTVEPTITKLTNGNGFMTSEIIYVVQASSAIGKQAIYRAELRDADTNEVLGVRERFIDIITFPIDGFRQRSMNINYGNHDLHPNIKILYNIVEQGTFLSLADQEIRNISISQPPPPPPDEPPPPPPDEPPPPPPDEPPPPPPDEIIPRPGMIELSFVGDTIQFDTATNTNKLNSRLDAITTDSFNSLFFGKDVFLRIQVIDNETGIVIQLIEKTVRYSSIGQTNRAFALRFIDQVNSVTLEGFAFDANQNTFAFNSTFQANLETKGNFSFDLIVEGSGQNPPAMKSLFGIVLTFEDLTTLKIQSGLIISNEKTSTATPQDLAALQNKISIIQGAPLDTRVSQNTVQQFISNDKISATVDYAYTTANFDIVPSFAIFSIIDVTGVTIELQKIKIPFGTSGKLDQDRLAQIKFSAPAFGNKELLLRFNVLDEFDRVMGSEREVTALDTATPPPPPPTIGKPKLQVLSIMKQNQNQKILYLIA